MTSAAEDCSANGASIGIFNGEFSLKNRHQIWSGRDSSRPCSPIPRFIVVFRQPVAVAYATKKWSHSSIPSLIEHSLLCYERFAKDLPHLKNGYTLRYEEFIASPQKVLDQLTSFIGVESITFPGK